MLRNLRSCFKYYQLQLETFHYCFFSFSFTLCFSCLVLLFFITTSLDNEMLKYTNIEWMYWNKEKHNFRVDLVFDGFTSNWQMCYHIRFLHCNWPCPFPCHLKLCQIEVILPCLVVRVREQVKEPLKKTRKGL